jgi:hypothetical protein
VQVDSGEILPLTAFLSIRVRPSCTKSCGPNFPDNSRNQNIFKLVKMGQGENGSMGGIPLKRAEALVLIMDTPKGTVQVDPGNVQPLPRQ